MITYSYLNGVSMEATQSVLEPPKLAGPQASLMMTLSAFASIDEAPLPIDVTRAHEEAILEDLGLALRQTTTSWSPIWVGLSGDDGANMAYIAQNNAVSGQYAVVIRGTDFAMLTDRQEDFGVQKTVQFPAVGRTVQIAAGTSMAHDLLVRAVGSDGNTLLDELAGRVGTDGEGSTIFVTGHSLGGALATTVALYLRSILQKADFQVYTFAAPTAGLTDFAVLYDLTFPGNQPGTNSSWRVYNVWDAVPQAWQADTLKDILSWYPAPGPAQAWWVSRIIEAIKGLPGDLPYQQPRTNVCQLNGRPWPEALSDSQADFLTEVGFQHDCNTYLKLLEAPTVSVLSSVTPNTLRRGTDSVTLTLTGLGFSSKTTVSFGNPDVSVESTVFHSQSQLEVMVSVADDAPAGPADVIVTSEDGDRIPGGTSSFLVY